MGCRGFPKILEKLELLISASETAQREWSQPKREMSVVGSKAGEARSFQPLKLTRCYRLCFDGFGPLFPSMASFFPF